MTHAASNLVLIGLRGSGKSTLGLKLSEQLGCGFIDLDEVTAQLLNCPGAGDAIAQHGMDAFRDAEHRALESELQTNGRVIALGGGTPTAPGCTDLLRESQSEGRCRVIYLKADASTLSSRLESSDNTDRPSLTGADVIDEVGTVHAERDPLYMELAESIIHTDGVTESSVLAALTALARAGV